MGSSIFFLFSLFVVTYSETQDAPLEVEIPAYVSNEAGSSQTVYEKCSSIFPLITAHIQNGSNQQAVNTLHTQCLNLITTPSEFPHTFFWNITDLLVQLNQMSQAKTYLCHAIVQSKGSFLDEYVHYQSSSSSSSDSSTPPPSPPIFYFTALSSLQVQEKNDESLYAISDEIVLRFRLYDSVDHLIDFEKYKSPSLLSNELNLEAVGRKLVNSLQKIVNSVGVRYDHVKVDEFRAMILNQDPSGAVQVVQNALGLLPGERGWVKERYLFSKALALMLPSRPAVQRGFIQAAMTDLHLIESVRHYIQQIAVTYQEDQDKIAEFKREKGIDNIDESSWLHVEKYSILYFVSAIESSTITLTRHLLNYGSSYLQYVMYSCDHKDLERLHPEKEPSGKAPELNEFSRTYVRDLLAACILNEKIDNKDVFAYLIERGADVSATSTTGYSALHYVLKFGHPGLIDRFLELSPDLTLRSVNTSFLPLHHAMWSNNAAVYEKIWWATVSSISEKNGKYFLDPEQYKEVLAEREAAPKEEIVVSEEEDEVSTKAIEKPKLVPLYDTHGRKPHELICSLYNSLGKQSEAHLLMKTAVSLELGAELPADMTFECPHEKTAEEIYQQEQALEKAHQENSQETPQDSQQTPQENSQENSEPSEEEQEKKFLDLKFDGGYAKIDTKTLSDSHPLFLASHRDDSVSFCDIETRTDLTIEDLFKDYVSLEKPVLIRNAFATNKKYFRTVRATFVKSFLREEYDNVEFEVAPIAYASTFQIQSKIRTMKYMIDYMTEFQTNLTSPDAKSTAVYEPDYVFEALPTRGHAIRRPSNLDADPRRISAFFSFPPQFDPKLTQIVPQKIQFFLGPALSGAPVHYHQSAWNFLVYGRKRWFMFPPTEAFYSTVPAHRWFKEEYPYYNYRPLECIQEAGDVLFIPNFWAHGVLNLAESIGFASEFTWVQAVVA